MVAQAFAENFCMTRPLDISSELGARGFESIARGRDEGVTEG